MAFKSFTEQYLDTCGIFRDAVIGIMATLAQQERIRISERTRAGLQRAVAEGRKLGRPMKTRGKLSRTTLWRRAKQQATLRERV